jgi:hypothetical protein
MVAFWLGGIGLSKKQATYSWLFLAVWVAVTAALGASGALVDFNRMPPPFLLFLVALVVVAVVLSSTPWGRAVAEKSSFRLLVGLQAFRLLPEIFLAVAASEGVMPPQMAWHGRNPDLLTAIIAVVLAALWPRLRCPRLWAGAFTALGLGLLANVVVVAVLSAPTPFRIYLNEPSSALVTTFPYIWLPGIHVYTALLLHALTLRKLGLPR